MLAQAIVGHIDRQPRQPGMKGLPILHRAEPLIGPHEDILREIGGILRLAEHAEDNAVHLRRVQLEKLTKGAVIPGLCSLHQVSIVNMRFTRESIQQTLPPSGGERYTE